MRLDFHLREYFAVEKFWPNFLSYVGDHAELNRSMPRIPKDTCKVFLQRAILSGYQPQVTDLSSFNELW